MELMKCNKKVIRSLRTTIFKLLRYAHGKKGNEMRYL